MSTHTAEHDEQTLTPQVCTDVDTETVKYGYKDPSLDLLRRSYFHIWRKRRRALEIREGRKKRGARGGDSLRRKWRGERERTWREERERMTRNMNGRLPPPLLRR